MTELLPRLLAPMRSIRFRIVAAFLAVLVAMLTSQGYLVWQQREITRSLALIPNTYLPLAKIVTQLDQFHGRVDTDLDRVLEGRTRPTSSNTQIYTDDMRDALAESRIHLDHAQATSPEEKAYLTRIDRHLQVIESLFKDWQHDASAFVALSEAGRTDEAGDLRQPMERDGDRLGDEIKLLARLIESRSQQLAEATRQAQSRATAVSVALAAVAFVFSAALVLAVLYALGPIGRLTTEVQRLAAGDYGGRVEVRGSDEIAILAAEFNAMVRALKHRDRTLVERAEQLNRLSRYLASVLDSLDDALLVVEDGQATLVNPAAVRIWGAQADAAAPEALAELVDRPGRHEIEGPGKTLHEVRVIPFAGTGNVVVAADVTDQTRTRDRLARSERLALIGQMLAQITHEVRNPLNALSLNAELLSEELAALDPERATEAWELLQTVADEIDRLTAVTGHYLQLARRPRATLGPEHLDALVDDVARLLAAELAQKRVELKLVLHPLAPQLVDGNQLKQAIHNVVRNAVEAGARHLELEVGGGDGEVWIALTDDGPGMSAEEAEKACEPFFSSKATGTGLGLAITKQILEDHDGTVRVDSTPGEGTRVVLAFPERPEGTAATAAG